MVEPIFNSGQILTFLAAVVGLWLVLRTGASDVERDMLSTEWALAIQAFGWALVGWAIVSLLCAPFIVVRNERALGKWYGGRFLYHSPLLIATIRAKPTGLVERYGFKFDHAEPGSFVYCQVKLEGATHLAKVSIGSTIFIGPMPINMDARTTGFLLKKDRKAQLWIQLPPNAVSVTARVYCLSFIIGELDDQDGTTGNLGQHPLRQPTQSHERGRHP